MNAHERPEAAQPADEPPATTVTALTTQIPAPAPADASLPSGGGVPLHDKAMAQAFLTFLDSRPDAQFLFMLNPERGHERKVGWPRHYHGTLDAVWRHVERFNIPAERIGVFVCFNEHPLVQNEWGRPKRGKEHVTRIRAMPVDADDAASVAAVLGEVGTDREPDGIVTTSPGKLHGYWRPTDLPVADYGPFVGLLIERFGSDPAVKDLARVMRLPGSLHLKGEPAAVTFEDRGFNPSPTTDLTAAFGFDLAKARATRHPVSTGPATMPADFPAPTPATLARMRAAFAAQPPGISPFAATMSLAGACVMARLAVEAILWLASTGRLNSYDEWFKYGLSAWANLAHDYPALRGDAETVVGMITQASERAGANTAKNASAWGTATPRGPGEPRTTIENVIQFALHEGWQPSEDLVNSLTGVNDNAPLSSSAPTGGTGHAETDQVVVPENNGASAPAPPPQPAAAPPSAQAAATTQPQAATIPVPFAERGDTRPQIFSAADLRRQTFAPIRYVVPGFIAEGCTLFAGAPKLGKSWFMLEVAIAVATGGTCLGGIACEQGDVLYLALEDNQRRLQRRMDKLLGINAPAWPSALDLATEWARAPGGLQFIHEWIGSKPKPRLIIVDVLQMFKPVRGAKDTLYEGDYLSIKGLQALAGHYGIAAVIVHHTRKGAAESDPFERVSGTLGLSGAADTTMILDRDSNGTTLYARGRDVEEIQKAVAFDKESCRWRVQGDASEVHRSGERNAILTALKAGGGAMSPKEIAAATGAKVNNTYKVLFNMAQAGEVVKADRGHYLPKAP